MQGVDVTCRDRCELRPLIWQSAVTEAWQIPCAGSQALFALLIVGMGALELRGGDLIWSHWGGMDDGGMLVRPAKFASHTIDDDGVSPRRHP